MISKTNEGVLIMANSKKQLAYGKSKSANLGVIILAVLGALIALTAVLYLLIGRTGAQAGVQDAQIPQGGNIQIVKNEITDTASFIPYDAGGMSMELIAVKASDGTVRTAFNTCQVCYDSGRGYYKQEGNELVCQNCGNRFQIDQIEKEKNGCNPVPILEEDKTDNGTTITISETYLNQYKELFGNWKKV